MAKYKLTWEDDFDFDLIGICSSNSDYRLCWGINKALSIQLTKAEDYSIKDKKWGENYYSFYEFENEETFETYHLIKNQSFTFKKLIPEQDKIDYFLIIKNNYDTDINDLVTRLKQVESILTAFVFDPNEIKSKSNLVF